MAAIERTAYPRFRFDLTSVEIAATYRPTEDELDFVVKQTHHKSSQLILLTLLKCIQRLGYFPKWANIPLSIRHFMCDELAYPRMLLPMGETKRTRRRHQQAIRQYLGLKPFQPAGAEIVTQCVNAAVAKMSDPADLINVALEQLRMEQIELPAFSTLRRQVRHLRATYHQQLFDQAATQLSALERQQLETLLDVPAKQRTSPFNRLKTPAGKPTLTNMRLWEERLIWLKTLPATESKLQHLTDTKRKQFASQARQLSLTDLRDIQHLGQRYLLLQCLLDDARRATYDQLTDMFLHRMRRTHRNAKSRLQQLREEYLALTEQLVIALGTIAQQARDTTDDTHLGSQTRQTLDIYGGADKLAQHADLVAAYQTDNHLPLLWDCHHVHRAILFRILDHLDLQSATQDTRILDALAFLQSYQKARRRYLPAEVDLDFADQRWRQLVKTTSKKQPVFRRRHFEVCVFHYIAIGLSRGDLYVAGSAAFADYRQQLLDWKTCQPMVAAFCEAVGLPSTAAAFVEQLRSQLRQRAVEVDAAFPNNEALTIDSQGQPHLKRTPKQAKPDDLELFQATVRDRLPERHLLDILRDVHRRIAYTHHFAPPSGNLSKMQEADRGYLLTVFGYGCGLGPTQTARHTRDGLSSRQLRRINTQHISIERLEAATNDVINEYARFDLPFLWGDGRHAVADGTHVKLLDNNLLGQHHFRYGEFGAIAYHHVSDTYVAIFSHFITCGVWEAVYILDGLLKNRSAIQPDILHADTQGQTAAVFGLAYMLGIQLMPRMRNWHRVDLCRPDADTTFEHIGGLFSRRVNWALIENHWQDLMQVILSIHAGKVLPSMLLQKLGAHNRRNKLYRAFSELGRAVRTLFLLDYLSQLQLRQSIQAATTVVERYNDFLDWLSFGDDGVIRTADPVEQEKRIKYLNLLANTIMLQNVVDMTNTLSQMSDEGIPVTKALVSHLSPYVRKHILCFGEYVLDLENPPDLDLPDNDFIRSLT